MSATGAGLSGVYINNSFSGAGAANAPAIKMTAGTLDHYFVTSCDSGCVSQVWNSSGNPVGSGMIESARRARFHRRRDQRRAAEHFAILPAEHQRLRTRAARFIQSGSAFASYGIDAANGWMFGSNTQAGWNAQISQSTAPNIDIAFAANYPPTGVSGHGVRNTGGAFSTGTYYVWVVSNTNSSCASQRRDVRAIEYFRPADGGRGRDHGGIQPHVDGGGRRARAPIQGYCVFVNNAKQYNFASQSTDAVCPAPARPSATVTDDRLAPGTYPITYQMVQEHHITPSGAIFNGNATPAAASGRRPTRRLAWRPRPAGHSFS